MFTLKPYGPFYYLACICFAVAALMLGSCVGVMHEWQGGLFCIIFLIAGRFFWKQRFDKNPQ